MNILVINSGSSSLKCSFFTEKSAKKIDITIERIAEEESEIIIIRDEILEERFENIPDHHSAFLKVIDILSHTEIIANVSEIEAVGYRVVHGGIFFSDSVLMSPEVKEKIDECSRIAPLHNPINLHCIELGEKILSHAKHVAVFDTAFHQTIPKKNYLYAIPKEYSQKYQIRKYGFHGISHQYVSQKLEEVTGKKYDKVISCHVGNGASITAIKDGKSINTSMGFTPVDGLVMGTRVGHIDPSAILFLQENEGLSAKETDAILNKKSGVLGLTGKVGDIEDLEHGIEIGNPDYELALDIYITRIVRFIGAFIADMGGVDAIIFTAGVLENSSNIRKMIAQRLDFAGVEFDEFQNLFRSEIRTISTSYSPTRLIVIPTDEETMIAQELEKLIS